MSMEMGRPALSQLAGQAEGTSTLAEPLPAGSGRAKGESDKDYYTRRWQEEQAMADQASCQASRTAHLELATRYALLSAGVRPAG